MAKEQLHLTTGITGSTPLVPPMHSTNEETKRSREILQAVQVCLRGSVLLQVALQSIVRKLPQFVEMGVFCKFVRPIPRADHKEREEAMKAAAFTSCSFSSDCSCQS